MSELHTRRLRLRAWLGSDEQPFIAMGHDPEVMEFFPAFQNPEQSLAAIARWNEELAQRGWSNWAVERIDTGTFIGFVGLSEPRRVLPFSPCVEVGWRLAKAHWGQGFASEAAWRAVQFGFEEVGLPEIVSFTALGNRRSRAVMERIGMRNAGEDFEHPGVPEGNPLRLHCLYRLSLAQWQSSKPAPGLEP